VVSTEAERKLIERDGLVLIQVESGNTIIRLIPIKLIDILVFIYNNYLLLSVINGGQVTENN